MELHFLQLCLYFLQSIHGSRSLVLQHLQGMQKFQIGDFKNLFNFKVSGVIFIYTYMYMYVQYVHVGT